MIRKEVIVGFVVGLLSAFIGIILFDIIIGYFNDLSLSESLNRAWSTRLLGKRVSIGALINLPVFYFFLNKKKDYHARGVLMATIMIAVIFIINKF
ncbi:hypothetical protein [Winogradskyella sp. A3E31]|uniref:hypothetical protein n=1 Tax=Winogradskyella sp. A3E31 TaxID=3349637 RepID=UPI00398AB520